MSTMNAFEHAEAQRAMRLALEGEERVALLPSAAFVAVTTGSALEDPVVVFIAWTEDQIERAYPGTAIYRAALAAYLRSEQPGDAAAAFVHAAAQQSLRRFPNLEAWIYWSDHERSMDDRRPREQRALRGASETWIGLVR